MAASFEEQGFRVVAVSANTEELAERTVEEWGLDSLTVGYGLGLEDAARWGLFVSSAASPAEPEHFVEPGLFLVRPDGTLYSSIVQTMPFSRPPGTTVLKTLAWIVENDYPARGEVASAPPGHSSP